VPLRGRERELSRIDELLGAARAGRGGALLLHGEAGIGKSALLAVAAQRATAEAPAPQAPPAHSAPQARQAPATFSLLRAGGYEASSALPYAGLRQLVAPLLPLRDQLSPVQAQALAVALALEPPTPQERLAVPLALAALLARAARARPLLAIVDDVQWLDPASREALLFAARRLGDAPVALLLAAREGEQQPFEAPGVPRLAVAPLDGDSARALLQSADDVLHEPVRDAVAAAAAGNPLALLELPAGLTPAQREGSAPLDLPLRPGPLLQDAFARRIAALAPAQRRAVTVAAALEQGPLAWLLAALARLGIPAAALDAAERTRIVVVAGGAVELRHPLLRIAAYYAADDEERRAAHRALAATAPDPRRRAWHLAAAAADADVDAAAALEAVAHEARAVGGHGEAAAAFERAAQLSATPADRGRRELEAAQDLATAGDSERARLLLDAAAAHGGEPLRAAVALLRGSLAIRGGDPHGALEELLREGERQLAAGDAGAAVRLFLEASVAPMMTGEVERQTEIVERARAAAAGGEAEVLAELLWGESLIAFGREAEGDAALAAVAGRLGEVDPVASGEVFGMAAQTSMWIGDFGRAGELVERMLAACRGADALGRMAYPLAVRSQLGFRRGRWQQAAADAADAVQLARDTGQEILLAFALASGARVAAVQGAQAQARAAIAEAFAAIDREQAAGVLVHVHGAAAVVELLEGRHDAAARAARAADELEHELGLRHPAAVLWGGELVDALVLAGRGEEARAAVDRVAERARATGSAWAAAVAARGELSLAPDERVDALAAAALAAQAPLMMPFERARTELAIGERLRRSHRRADARPPLARALAGFERLGAAPFAARSRVGLEAPLPQQAAALTPQERRIVELVADGRTNREIAAALALGEKTLERRLTALYRKAGVSSRTELARTAGAPGDG
jgi:DNA-binding CsgD family transcriptional regulator